MVERFQREVVDSKQARKNISKSTLLNVHWHQLCNTFSKLSSSLDDALKESFIAFCILAGGSVDVASAVVRGTDRLDSQSGSESYFLGAIAGSSSSVFPAAGVVCGSVLLAKLDEYVSVEGAAESHLEAPECSSDLRPTVPPVVRYLLCLILTRHHLPPRSVPRSLLLRVSYLVPGRSSLQVMGRSSLQFFCFAQLG